MIPRKSSCSPVMPLPTVGAMLSHRMEYGSEKPIAFACRTLAPAEKRYAQLDKEALAIIYWVLKISSIPFGRRFTIYSDHKPLQYILFK